MGTEHFRMPRSCVAGIEAMEATTRHAFPRHAHDHYGIGLVYGGAQRSWSGRGAVEAGPGDVITCNPGEVHDGAPIGEAARSWRIVYMEPELIEAAARDIADGAAADYQFTRPVLADAPALAARFHAWFVALTSAEPLRAEELLLALVAAAPGERGRLQPPARDDGRVSAAVERLADDPAAPVTLADLARETGLSRFQVLRGFVRATGLTPHAWLVQKRLGLAKRLIGRGLPLAEAALAAGFADQSHLTRSFVRAFGISPGAYARAVA